MTSVISRIRPATSLFSRHLALSRSAAAGNSVLQTSYFHTSNQQHAKMKTIMKQAKDPPYYKRMNEIVYPPQKEGELRRPAEINHWRMRIKYSPDKMWYIACLIRGMSIDDALKQLTFYKREGGQIVKDVLLEAQEKAVKEHNVEYKSNLWVAESVMKRQSSIKGVCKTKRGPTKLNFRFCSYHVRLMEGPPPKEYYTKDPDGWYKMQEYIEEMRGRTIQRGL